MKKNINKKLIHFCDATLFFFVFFGLACGVLLDNGVTPPMSEAQGIFSPSLTIFRARFGCMCSNPKMCVCGSDVGGWFQVFGGSSKL